jgi:hypothetical protein
VRCHFRLQITEGNSPLKLPKTGHLRRMSPCGSTLLPQYLDLTQTKVGSCFYCPITPPYKSGLCISTTQATNRQRDTHVVRLSGARQPILPNNDTLDAFEATTAITRILHCPSIPS